MLKSKNLLNYYPFEGNADDAVGGNNFTVSGATQSLYVVNPKGAFLFGGNGGVNFGNILNDYIVGATKKFAFSFFIVFSSLDSANFIITKYDTTPKRQFVIQTDSSGSVMAFGFVSNTTNFEDYAYILTDTDDFNLEVGKLYHCVINIDMNQAQVVDRAKFIINGNTIASTLGNNSGTPTYIKTQTGDLVFGVRATNTSDPLKGIMSDVSFWDDNLTLSEATEIYNNGLGKFYSNSSPYNNGHLISYWPLTISPTTGANDLVGDYDGTNVDAKYVNNKIGSNYSFDGTNDYMYLDTAIDLGAGTTVCMWIDFSNPIASANYFIGSNTTNPDGGIRYTPGSPTGSILFYAPGATSGNYTSLNYNFPESMCHLAIVRTANRNVDWYVNGSKIGSSDPGANAVIPVKSIGRRNATNTYYSRCKIDDLCFFNQALSQNNIRRVML